MPALPTFELCPAGTLNTASSRLRCHVLARELARQGCAVHVGLEGLAADAPPPDVLVVQKCHSPEIVARARAVRAAGGLVVFDIDDWGDAVPWVKAEPARLAEILALASVVTVDTDTRADVFAKDPAYAAVPAIWVVPDPVDYVDAPPSFDLPNADRDRLLAGCWFGNGPNLPPTLPWVQAAIATGRLHRFGIITNAQFVPQMQAAWPVLSVEAWALDTFPARLRAHDFCLLIHDTNLEGVQKSNNKMLAALGQGVVPLVSDTPAYAETARRIGLPELIVQRPEDLAARLAPGALDALRARLASPQCRAVLDAFMPATVARGFLGRVQAARSRPVAAGSAAAAGAAAPQPATAAVAAPMPAQPRGPDTFAQSLDALVQAWQESPYPTTKVSSYFPAYVKLFGHLRGTRCTFVETGILDGGSLFMWRRWLGDQARIVGLDMNPQAARWREHGFEIHLGDQGDPAFWRDTLARTGPFDALLDDGGHQSFQQIVTLAEALRAQHRPAVIAIEDTATSFMHDFAAHGAHSFLEYAKAATDCVAGRAFGMYPGRFPAEYNRRAVQAFGDVFSVQFFNGIVALETNPAWCAPPRVIQNRPRGVASDFRYEGRDHALVDWPDVRAAREVRVQGGPAPAATTVGAAAREAA